MRRKPWKSTDEQTEDETGSAAPIETFGWRIREARDRKSITQHQLAQQIGLKRAAIAQWERNESTPSLSTIREAAEYLGTAPEFLAFGIGSQSESAEAAAGEPNCSLVPEVEFRDSPDDRIHVRSWGLPTDWLRAELNLMSPESLIVFRIDGAMSQKVGDRVIVDCNQRRPSPPGYYLHWDGMAAVVSHIAVVPATGTQSVMACVTGTAGTYELPADELALIGRVRGAWRRL